MFLRVQVKVNGHVFICKVCLRFPSTQLSSCVRMSARFWRNYISRPVLDEPFDTLCILFFVLSAVLV
jgi:hypothetical protein